MNLSRFIFFISIVLLFSCSSTTRVDHIPKKVDGRRDLLVFFDGTANDESSHTNVAKLHNLVTLQDRPDISASYIHGVGTGTKVIGMAMGWGIGNDVREAYLYLLENHQAKHDHISIFGFSRGAYAARILSALLYVAGLPEVQHLNKKQRIELVDDIYQEYKSKQSIPLRRLNIANRIRADWSAKHVHPSKPVYIEFLGLWDTVEALGLPDYEENINEPNALYADQLCNIKVAAHALAIDDNRARVFTPLLLTRKHLRQENCDASDLYDVNNIHEVWFSGAHSDVGGGYKDTSIDGVSLNWMLDKIKIAGLNLVPDKTKVYSDYLGKTHNPEAGLFGLVYRARNRNLACYTELKGSSGKLCVMDSDDVDYKNSSTAASSPIKIHQSVLDRLCMKTPEPHESYWFREKKFENCLICDAQNIGSFIKNERCDGVIKIINNENYTAQADRGNRCDYSACVEARNSSYKGSKSCNFEHPLISQRAKQRLNAKRLDEFVTGKEIVIFADLKNDRTGLILAKGQPYRFSISGVENWVDCTINASPLDGRPDFSAKRSLLSNVVSISGKPIAYAPLSGYMALLGEVGGQQFKLGQAIKNKTSFTPRQDGELIIRVNEPRFLKMVYDNNFGVLKLTVTPAKEPKLPSR